MDSDNQQIERITTLEDLRLRDEILAWSKSWTLEERRAFFTRCVMRGLPLFFETIKSGDVDPDWERMALASMRLAFIGFSLSQAKGSSSLGTNPRVFEASSSSSKAAGKIVSRPQVFAVFLTAIQLFEVLQGLCCTNRSL